MKKTAVDVTGFLNHDGRKCLKSVGNRNQHQRRKQKEQGPSKALKVVLGDEGENKNGLDKEQEVSLREAHGWEQSHKAGNWKEKAGREGQRKP